MKKLALLMLAIALSVAPLHAAKTKEPEKKKKFDPAEEINKPRPDARTVKFTTSEATWSSVDLSPDGSTI
ncbi:MAG TPA: hypothetical protein VJ276_03760, partial [Thermoanaerobaculia bacterium]|nr:hypothetical protein [Thermoanaerobaculia bacterium]